MINVQKIIYNKTILIIFNTNDDQLEYVIVRLKFKNKNKQKKFCSKCNFTTIDLGISVLNFKKITIKVVIGLDFVLVQ